MPLSAAGDLPSRAPLIGPLADNGGPTDTVALLPGSPAPDATDGCPATDRRGVARPKGATCDIGAYGRTPYPPTPTPAPGVMDESPESAPRPGQRRSRRRGPAAVTDRSPTHCPRGFRPRLPGRAHRPGLGAGSGRPRRRAGLPGDPVRRPADR
ncbi:choice-of-anchor Q domain-containing protein [Streptomyces sp. NPDC102395]|uniref:choice-of-anchor Q domain-containing protein n=1 Tax=Streptomyces sp. NPDC102395 TaxID=3366168 RepID=UPI00381FBB54